MNRLSVVVALALAAGCAHQEEKKPEAPVAPQASSSNPNTQMAQTAPQTGTCNADLDCAAKQLCIRGRCVDITADLAECSNVRVHFEFNASELAESDKAGLERSARCLKADHDLHVTIEGNADERGTEEYNLALGDRRATTVARYLESLGASAAQLKTVSFGKENPLCVEHDEDCWQRNRRAELQVGNPTKKKK